MSGQSYGIGIERDAILGEIINNNNNNNNNNNWLFLNRLSNVLCSILKVDIEIVTLL
jgi:hypothetical protein